MKHINFFRIFADGEPTANTTVKHLSLSSLGSLDSLDERSGLSLFRRSSETSIPRFTSSPVHRNLKKVALLLFVLMLGIGQMWGAETYICDANNFNHANFIVKEATQNQSATIHDWTGTKMIKLASNKDNVNHSDTSYCIRYDNKTNATKYIAYFYNGYTNDKIAYVTIVKNSDGSAVTRSKTLTKNGGIDTIEVNTTERASIFAHVGQTSMYIAQVKVEESGTKTFPIGGAIGYETTFNKPRLMVAANKVGRLDGIEYCPVAEVKPTSNSDIRIQTFGTNYIKFTLLEATKIKITTTNNVKFTFGSAKNSAGSIEYGGSAATHEVNLKAGTYFMNPVQNASTYIKITKIEFTEADVTYDIVYDKGTGTGTPPTEEPKPAGTTIQLKSADNLSKSNCKFVGWLCNVDGELYQANDNYTMTAANTTFTAQWSEYKTVTYNHGSHGSGSEYTNLKYQGIDLNLSTKCFTRTNYVQVGWATSDGGAMAYKMGGVYSKDEDITLYPVWATTTTYSSSLDVTGGETLTSLESKGWYFTHVSGTVTDASAEANTAAFFASKGVTAPGDRNGIAIAKNTSAYAQFDLGEETTVSKLELSLLGGSNSGFDEVVEYLDAEMNVIKSYTNTLNAGNWGANSITYSDIVPNVRYIRINGASKWVMLQSFSVTYAGAPTPPATTYSITYNENKPSSVASSLSFASAFPTNETDVESPHIMKTAPNLVPNGESDVVYTFAGWNTAAAGSGDSYDTITSYTLTDDLELFAQWTAKEFDVIYYADTIKDDATPTIDGLTPSAYTFEGLTLSPIPEGKYKPGYNFTGWYRYSSGIFKPITSTLTGYWGTFKVYASWTPIEYTITYNNLNGATAPTKVKYTIEDETFALADPTNLPTGYTFDGWYDTAGGTGNKVESITNGSTGNITLYAKWNTEPTPSECDEYQFISNDGTKSSNFTNDRTPESVPVSFTFSDGKSFTKCIKPSSTSNETCSKNKWEYVSITMQKQVGVFKVYAYNKSANDANVIIWKDGTDLVYQSSAIAPNSGDVVTYCDQSAEGHTFYIGLYNGLTSNYDMYIYNILVSDCSDSPTPTQHYHTIIPNLDGTQYECYGTYTQLFNKTVGPVVGDINDTKTWITGSCASVYNYVYSNKTNWLPSNTTSLDGSGSVRFAEGYLKFYITNCEQVAILGCGSSTYSLNFKIEKSDGTLVGTEMTATSGGLSDPIELVNATQLDPSLNYVVTIYVPKQLAYDNGFNQIRFKAPAPTTYTITYDCDNADSGCPENVASATALPNPLPAAPVKTGYTFDKWYTNSEKTTPAVAGATLTADVTLYAKWTAKTYTLTLKRNDGTDTQVEVTVTYDAVCPQNMPDWSRTGYTFADFYTAAEGGEKITKKDGSTWEFEGGTHTGYTASKLWKGTENKTLYAHWDAIKVTKIELNQTSLTKTVGDADVTLTATVTPETALDKTIEWSSSDATVASVTGGVVSFLKAGSATITATAHDGSGKKATCSVTVNPAVVHVTGVSLNKTTTSIAVGGTETLTATVAPDNATNQNVTWSIINDNANGKISVDQTGKVTVANDAVAGATTTVQVTTEDGSKTATCIVTVTSAEKQYATSVDFAAEAAKNAKDAAPTDDQKKSLFTDHNITISDYTSATLDPDTREGENNVYTGLKIKNEGTVIYFWVPANYNVTIKTGVTNGLDLYIDGTKDKTLESASKSTSPYYKEYSVKKTTDAYYEIKTTSASTNVIKSITITTSTAVTINVENGVNGALTASSEGLNIITQPQPKAHYYIEGVYTTDALATKVMTCNPNGSNLALVARVDGFTDADGKWICSDATKTLYAKQLGNQYTIVYKDQGGGDYSGSNASALPSMHTYGTATQLVAGVKDGFTFDGWYINQECTGDPITSLAGDAVIANGYHLYAKWTTSPTPSSVPDVENLTRTADDNNLTLTWSFPATSNRISVDLSNAQSPGTHRKNSGGGANTITGSVNELYVNFDLNTGWQNMEVHASMTESVANVTSISLQYKGSNRSTGFYPFINTGDKCWWKDDGLSLASSEWQENTFYPTSELYAGNMGDGANNSNISDPVIAFGCAVSDAGAVNGGEYWVKNVVLTRSEGIELQKVIVRHTVGAKAGSITDGDFVCEGLLNGYVMPLPTSGLHYYTVFCVDGDGNASEGLAVSYGTACPAPTISTQPTAQEKKLTEQVSFSIAATDATSYQWYTCEDVNKTNLLPIANATNTTYEFTADVVDTKYYCCEAINDCGSTFSDAVGCIINPIEFTVEYTTAVENGQTYTEETFTANRTTTREDCIANLSGWTFTGVTLSGTASGGTHSMLLEPVTRVSSEDLSKYISFSFDVKPGYLLTVNSITLPIKSEGGSGHHFKAVLADESGHEIIGTKTTSSTSATTVDFGALPVENQVLRGHVTLTLYCWVSSSNKYRLGKNTSIQGTISTLPAPQVGWNKMPIGGDLSDEDWEISATSSNCTNITYSSTVPTVASIVEQDGKYYVHYLSVGSTTIQASVTGNGTTTFPKTVTAEKTITVANSYEPSTDVLITNLSGKEVTDGYALSWTLRGDIDLSQTVNTTPPIAFKSDNYGTGTSTSYNATTGELTATFTDIQQYQCLGLAYELQPAAYVDKVSYTYVVTSTSGTCKFFGATCDDDNAIYSYKDNFWTPDLNVETIGVCTPAVIYWNNGEFNNQTSTVKYVGFFANGETEDADGSVIIKNINYHCVGWSEIDKLVLVRKLGSEPQNWKDGTTIKLDADVRNYVDTDFPKSGTYYYKLYAFAGNTYSASECIHYDYKAQPNIFQTAGNWSESANWSMEVEPTTNHDVVIAAKATISAGTHAVANSIVINEGMSIDIASTASLQVEGTITRADGTPTQVSDIYIHSDKNGSGSLVFDNSDGTTQAAVESYSLARQADNGSRYWQYAGVQTDNVDFNTDFYGAYTYLHQETNPAYWTRVKTGKAQLFKAYGITKKAICTYLYQGHLAPTTTQELSLTYSDGGTHGVNMVANSWTAPIDITKLNTDDFGGAEATIYIYNTGNDSLQLGEDQKPTEGQWISISVEATKALDYEGLSVIPSGQAFEVHTSKNATLTLRYDDVVRQSSGEISTEPMRSPARKGTDNYIDPQTIHLMRIRVAGQKVASDIYLAEDERFNLGYDNGWDAYFGGGDERTMMFYSVADNQQMTINALPTIEGTLLGFEPNADQLFTISFKYNGDATYYLNDIQEQKSTLISNDQTYMFMVGSYDLTHRFQISSTPYGSSIITGNHGAKADKQGAIKFIDNNHLYILHHGNLFDGQGKLVK